MVFSDSVKAFKKLFKSKKPKVWPVPTVRGGVCVCGLRVRTEKKVQEAFERWLGTEKVRPVHFRKEFLKEKSNCGCTGVDRTELCVNALKCAAHET